MHKYLFFLKNFNFTLPIHVTIMSQLMFIFECLARVTRFGIYFFLTLVTKRNLKISVVRWLVYLNKDQTNSAVHIAACTIFMCIRKLRAVEMFLELRPHACHLYQWLSNQHQLLCSLLKAYLNMCGQKLECIVLGNCFGTDWSIGRRKSYLLVP